MLAVLSLIGLIASGTLALVLLAWRLPTKRHHLSLVAMCTAALGSLIATVSTNIIAVGACAGESVDLSQKERIGAVLLAPMAWLGTRGMGLHDRMVHEAFSHVTSSSLTSDALSDAVTIAGDERTVLEARARVAQQLRRQGGPSVFEWIERSGLLVDDIQRREVSRRSSAARRPARVDRTDVSAASSAATALPDE